MCDPTAGEMRQGAPWSLPASLPYLMNSKPARECLQIQGDVAENDSCVCPLTPSAHAHTGTCIHINIPQRPRIQP